MLAVVVLSGAVVNDNRARIWLQKADYIVAVDGGARHLRRLHMVPDILIGDLDSIQAEDLDWARRKKVPLEKFPAQKDETDSELALQLLAKKLPLPATSHQIVVLGALGSRPDHVLANQLLAANMAASGWRLLLSDGESDLYTLIGGQTLKLSMADLAPGRGKLAVSAVPISSRIDGLTYCGLSYPLKKETLIRGTTRGISNELLPELQAMTRGEQASVEISLEKGLMLLIITPAK